VTATTIPADVPSPNRLVVARRADVRTKVSTAVQVARLAAGIPIRATARTRTSLSSRVTSAEAIAEVTKFNVTSSRSCPVSLELLCKFVLYSLIDVPK
jgi:hypothetical protein